MSDVVVMPAMTVPQEQAWLTLLDLYEEVPGHWTLVGGQMVHLWCAERATKVARPTDDADAVLDVRLKRSIHLDFTTALKERGFEPETSTSGVQHRWAKGEAVIDVLVPRFLDSWGRGARTSKAPAVVARSKPQVRKRSSTGQSSSRFRSVIALERYPDPRFSAP